MDKSGNQVRWIILAFVCIIIFIVVVVAYWTLNGDSFMNSGEDEQVATEGTSHSGGSSSGTSSSSGSSGTTSTKVNEVTLERVKISYVSGTYKISTKVTNDNIAKVNLRFKIKIIAKDGGTITEVIGYVGKIKANEVKVVDSYVTVDISDLRKLVYEVIK